MLANNLHIGKTSCSMSLRDYIWCRREDKVYIINIYKTVNTISMLIRVIIAYPKKLINIYSKISIISKRDLFSRTNFIIGNIIGSRKLRKMHLDNPAFISIFLHINIPTRLVKFFKKERSITSGICNTNSVVLSDFPLICNINSKYGISLLIYIFKLVERKITDYPLIMSCKL